MKRHKLHPISFEAAIQHIKNGNRERVYVRNGNAYCPMLTIQLDLDCWYEKEFYYEEEHDV